jgi:hypothetical protein
VGLGQLPVRSPTRVAVRNLPKVPPFALIRAAVLGLLAVVVTGWWVVHHITHKPPPMRVPAPRATEIPAPELVPSE